MATPQQGALVAGRYRLVEVIGRGGMGEVWRASDELLHRDVAVKTLAAAMLGNQGMRERFRREALAVARLNDRRIARVFDYIDEPNAAFIVMELLVGQTLADRLAQQPILPPGEAAEIVAQAAEGLQAAHDAGITHRDIKPANIMLTALGVKLLDFGIAATAWDSRLTTTGILVGTLAYLPPERAAGEPATPAGDLYALGVILYEALAGHPPFNADNPLALVRAHAADEPPALPPTTPPALAVACRQALAKDPAARPRDSAVLAAMLRGQVPASADPTVPLGAAGPLKARNATAFLPADNLAGQSGSRAARGRLPSWIRDRRVLAALVAAVVLVIVLIAMWPTPQQPRAAAPPPMTSSTPPPVTTPSTTQPPNTPAPRPIAPPPAAPPQPTTPAAAMAALQHDIVDGSASGAIQPDTAKDLEQSLSDLQDKIDKGQTNNIDHRLNDLDQQIGDKAREGDITAPAANTLRADLNTLAATLGASQ